MNRWIKWLSNGAIATLSLVLTSVGKGYALPIPIPGTTVVIEPPPGFTLSENFSGLEHVDSGSSLTINEFPAEAYTQLSPLFSTQEDATEAFLRQGILVEERTTVDVGTAPLPLIYGIQQSPIGTVEKYITLMQGDNTVLLTFNILDPTITSREAVEAAIASINLASAPTLEEKVAQLPFSFEAFTPFELRDVIGGSSALLTTFEGTDPSGEQPVIIIAKGQSAVYETNLAELSETLLRGTQGFALADITYESPTSFANGNGYLLEADQNGISIIQYTHVGTDQRHLRLVATGATTELNRMREAVMSVATSVTHID